MRKSVRTRHTDGVKYVIYVLWLIGHTERAIAQVVGVRTKQVAGLIARSEYAGRSFMTDAERAEKLKELKGVRLEDGVALDSGLLDRVAFEIIPLGTSKSPGATRRRL